MRVLLMHPDYHSGGYDDIVFIDAISNRLTEEQVRAAIEEARPDIVGLTAITLAIYKAERLLQMAKEVDPPIVTVLGGIHGTFMYPQVLAEAPWIDAIVRREGEQVFLNLVKAVDEGRFVTDRQSIHGIAFQQDGKVVATPAEPTIRDLDRIQPDWGILDWGKHIYIPLGKRVAIPNFARGCPFTCTFCSQRRVWHDYRVRDPIEAVDEIENLLRNHDVGFFILADEEPTIHRKKFVELCEELIRRNLPVLWGINTRVTDILRDEKLLPLYRKAGMIHVSLGTEAAAQLKLERFNKETTIAQNKKAIQLLRDANIVGLENETAQTLEETYRMVMDWKPDMAKWAMYRPWPFSDLVKELGDKVEIFDFDKFNFVTPIIKPDAMERGELLDRVMNNYRRFYMRKSFLEHGRGGRTRPHRAERDHPHGRGDRHAQRRASFRSKQGG